MKDKVKIKAKFLSGALCWAFVAAMISFAYYDKYNGDATQNFATTKATILESSPHFVWYLKRYHYKPHLKYEYQVGDKSYECSRISYPDPDSDTKSSTEKYLDNYPIGKRVPIFFDKNNPANAVLKQGTQHQDIYIVMAVIMFVFGLVFVATPGQKNDVLYVDEGKLPAWLFNIVKAE